MFKIYGLILLMISGYLFFTNRIRENLYSYQILNDVIKMLQLLKLECGTGKSYTYIFQNSQIDLFTEYDAAKPALYFDDLSIDIKMKKEITELFCNLGKRQAEEEKKYIDQYIERFKYKATEYKISYDKNYKACSVAGISMGMMIFIIII